MSFPRYANYKDSGVEWLGEVPEHWELDRLKRSTISCRNGIWGEEAQHDDDDIPCVRVADFDRQRLRVELSEPTIRNVVQKERIGRVLSRGDLLLEKSGGGELQPVGCVVLYDDVRPAVCSNFLARVQVASGMNSSFWRYVHAATYAVRLNTRSIKQTSGIQNLDQQQYLDERVGFPPHEEQTLIAEFLDWETAKIDCLVAEQLRLIELLKEKRQAVISHAVTKGLNPHVPMKSSGIEWLGDVPGHWEVVALKHLVSKPIIDGPHESPRKCDDGVPFVSAESVSKGFVDFDKIWGFISPEDHARYSQRYRPQWGDILLVKLGATTGTVAIVETEANFNIWVPLAAIRVKYEIEPRFVFHVLRSDNLRRAYELSWTYGTQQTLGLGTISNLRLPVPPKRERLEIVQYLDSILPSFESLTTEAQRAIDLLQERRTALISAAVTGKIDARGLVETDAA